ncbi:MAG: NAD(P)-dependent glycerol-3-phosphate dehydrogenase [Phreatobacter sp.]|uniref:NAD(P)H-dependent glycerol-3-phosphate dehydrogenase n=1 Tax=Phreatobacter sp. TaxID=1966341 RepID=UPI001A47D3F1|nr:NAD(P)H-dependent glycerol-3-phosphate dehydrogenase [Phreatobacter sp.]MBL8567996.1 NAD(P)-dependent glycerol-3-phosphate dehydrogenase [Phreatobacter sp.]
MTKRDGIAVIGAGAWGTALAQVNAAAGRPTRLWARRADVVESVVAARENRPCLPGIALDPRLAVSSDLEATLESSSLVILAVPSAHVAALARRLTAIGTRPLVLAAKGLEPVTHRLLADALAAILPSATIAVLSGPSFAADVARGLPTAVTLACVDGARARDLAGRLATPSLRIYSSDDLVGVQIGGAVKNVIAIACGLVIGRGLGESARAAVLTRGLAEMARLGAALGARRETLMGLSGLGDLALTCSSPQSRNHSLGLALGRGEPLAALLAGRRSVVEGVEAAAAIAALAAERAIDMPIVVAVNAILRGEARIDDAVAALLARPLKEESDAP